MASKLVNDKQLEQVETEINHFMEEEILKKGKTIFLNKWNYFSLMGLMNPEAQNKFLECVKYIEEMSFEKDKEISQILTLAYLIIKEKLAVSNMDVNDIYLLVSYLDTLEINNVSGSLNKLNDRDLLFAIRMKTLDIEIRSKILSYIDKENKKKQEMLQMLKEMEYYDFLEVIG